MHILHVVEIMYLKLWLLIFQIVVLVKAPTSAIMGVIWVLLLVLEVLGSVLFLISWLMLSQRHCIWVLVTKCLLLISLSLMETHAISIQICVSKIVAFLIKRLVRGLVASICILIERMHSLMRRVKSWRYHLILIRIMIVLIVVSYLVHALLPILVRMKVTFIVVHFYSQIIWNFKIKVLICI